MGVTGDGSAVYEVSHVPRLYEALQGAPVLEGSSTRGAQGRPADRTTRMWYQALSRLLLQSRQLFELPGRHTVAKRVGVLRGH